MATKEKVDQLITSEKVVIFAKPTCPFCVKAKDVFDEIRQPYAWVDLTKEREGDEMQAYLGELTGAKTVPRVFIGGKCVGGGSETEQLYKSGLLQQLLN